MGCSPILGRERAGTRPAPTVVTADGFAARRGWATGGRDSASAARRQRGMVLGGSPPAQNCSGQWSVVSGQWWEAEGVKSIDYWVACVFCDPGWAWEVARPVVGVVSVAQRSRPLAAAGCICMRADADRSRGSYRDCDQLVEFPGKALCQAEPTKRCSWPATSMMSTATARSRGGSSTLLSESAD